MNEATFFEIHLTRKVKVFVVVGNYLDNVSLEIKGIKSDAFISLTPLQSRQIAKELLRRAV